MRGRIEERQQVIEHTFNIVHNGPLQDLADIRRIAASEPNLQSIAPKLEGLDQAIRSLYVRLEQSAQAEQQQPTLLLGDLSLSLDQSLERNLYEVYAPNRAAGASRLPELKGKTHQIRSVADRGPLPQRSSRYLSLFRRIPLQCRQTCHPTDPPESRLPVHRPAKSNSCRR
jgi:hypothetical protein